MTHAQLALVLAALAALPAAAQEKRLVTVSGDAEVRVTPDEVLLTLGVETSDLDLAVAKRSNDERIAAVLASAEAHGVERKQMQTDYFDIEPRYEHHGRERIFLGYFVRKTVVITLRELERFEALLSAALEAGASHVHGIDFRTTELRRHRDRARSLAIQAAREKAEALAGELGQQVGPPSSIREDRAGWWSWYGSWWGSRRGGPMAQNVVQNASGQSAPLEGPTAPGQLSVTARVTVSFELR